jgi:hypothetical protein
MKKLILAAAPIALFLNAAAFAGVQDQVCQAVTEAHYGFATQVACIVTVKSAKYFDQNAAALCLQVAKLDKANQGLDVKPCLTAIADKSYEESEIGSCANALDQDGISNAITCLGEAGHQVP